MQKCHIKTQKNQTWERRNRRKRQAGGRRSAACLGLRGWSRGGGWDERSEYKPKGGRTKISGACSFKSGAATERGGLWRKRGGAADKPGGRGTSPRSPPRSPAGSAERGERERVRNGRFALLNIMRIMRALQGQRIIQARIMFNSDECKWLCFCRSAGNRQKTHSACGALAGNGGLR